MCVTFANFFNHTLRFYLKEPKFTILWSVKCSTVLQNHRSGYPLKFKFAYIAKLYTFVVNSPFIGRLELTIPSHSPIYPIA